MNISLVLLVIVDIRTHPWRDEPPPGPILSDRAPMVAVLRRNVWWAESDEPDEHAHQVLLIDGQPGSSLIWTRLRPALRSYGLRVLDVDRLCHGHTAGTVTSQFQKAAALIRILDEQRSSPTVVVGHGLGAGTAISLAVIAPHRVRSLVLVAPCAGESAITRTRRMLAAPLIGPAVSWLRLRAAGTALGVPWLRRRVLAGRFGLTTDQADQVGERLRHSAQWRDFTVEQRHLVTDARQLEQHLPGIQCPVVIVAGARDRIVGLPTIAAISRKLPDSDVITTDTGHLIPVDDPGAVVTAVLRALGAHYRKSLHERRPSLDR